MGKLCGDILPAAVLSVDFLGRAAKGAQGLLKVGRGVGKGGHTTQQLLRVKGTYLSKPENVNKLEKFIIRANELTEGKGTLSGLGTTPASAIDSAVYHSTEAEQGAAIFRSIVQGHMFENGNKRTAVAFWKEFQRLHGVRSMPSEERLLDIASKVAKGKLNDIATIAEALSK